MKETKAFYYWAVVNHENFERVGDKYRITQQQLQNFLDLTTDLLSMRDVEQAQVQLPPYPACEIGDEYWEDLEQTREILQEVISEIDNDTDTGSLYYVGKMPN